MKQQQIKAFTLVELIIVITILAILATIGFMSFQSYTMDARDANRVTTINEIGNGLSISYLKKSKYPLPDGTISTGTIDGINYTYKGTIGDSISKLIKMEKSIDPLSKEEYVYGINTDQTQYQIATVLENNTVANLNITNTTYADLGVVAKVNGNYPGYLKYSTGGYLYIANIPSLLWNNNGGVNLLNNSTQFIIDKKTNLPYKLNSGTDLGTKDANTIIREITGTGIATLTGVNITNITNSNIRNTFSGVILASFGGDINRISTSIIGGSVATIPTSCLGTIPDEISKVSNATSFAGGTRNYNITPGLCTYSCNTSYHTENSGVSCISDTKSCAITNGVGTQTWNTTTNTWGTCTVVTCNTGYTNVSNICTAIGSSSSAPGLSCLDIKTKLSSSIDGTYWIKPDANAAFQVYCDMTTNGGGWTLVRKLISTVIVDGGTADLNKTSLATLTTASAHISDTTYNAINPTQVWNICNARQTIYIRNMSTAWYSNHGTVRSCSYNKNFWTGMKKDFTSTIDSSFTYQSCGGGNSATYGSVRGILSGIYVTSTSSYGCYDAGADTNTTSAVAAKYDNRAGTAIGWRGNGYVLIR